MNNPLDIKCLDIHTLDVPLKVPFTTSSAKLEVIHNLAIQITLADGSKKPTAWRRKWAGRGEE
jgi:hypothetical protein